MSDDIIKRLCEAIAEHPLSPIHGYAADIDGLLDRLDKADRENERLRARHVALVCPQCSWTLEPSERREG